MSQGARNKAQTRKLKALVFSACLLPLGALVYGGFNGGLGANPLETITHETGEWALRLLLVTLAVTPLREAFGWNRLIQFRRMLGLFAFFYVCLHLSTYLVFDHFFDVQGILEDIIERPYVTLGMTGFLLLLPLAVTSTNGWIRRLGRYWRRLHRIVYVAAIAAVLHFLWLVKADLREPLIYAAILIMLLGFRLLPEHCRKWSKSHRKTAPRRASESVAVRNVSTAILESSPNARD
jgi:sulfoxide reductase heme-binding subunit YedZ